MRGTGGTHCLRRKRCCGGAGGVDFWGLVEGAGQKDEEGAIGGDGEVVIEIADADGAGVGEDRRVKTEGALDGKVGLQAEAHESIDAAGEL